jgi:hypothetical protein
MNTPEIRRPLEDVIGELVDGLAALPPLDGCARDLAGLSLTSVELTLPIETRVLGGPAGLVVHADMPALRTRTAFDLPVGRLVMRLSATGTGGAP